MKALPLLALLLPAFARAQTPVPAAPEPPRVDALQVALDRNGFGVGPIDGIDGPRTRGALADFARSRRISAGQATGELTAQTGDPLEACTLTEGDRDAVGEAPEDWEAAAAVPGMAFRSLAEMLAERFHASPRYLERLNPEWELSAAPGRMLRVPAVRPAPPWPPIGWLEIDATDFRLRVFATNGLLCASFPCSTAADPARIPAGGLRIVAFAPDPVYVFDPANFPESARAQEIGRKLILPPGPNNPVGVYWLSLDRAGFGLHGTPHPETIGRPESHGCFRLTNWDIRTLASRVQVGTPVRLVRIPGR